METPGEALGAHGPRLPATGCTFAAGEGIRSWHGVQRPRGLGRRLRGGTEPAGGGALRRHRRELAARMDVRDVRGEPGRGGRDRRLGRHHHGPQHVRSGAAAGDRNISIAGGATTVNQFLAAGLLDELRLHITLPAGAFVASRWARSAPSVSPGWALIRNREAESAVTSVVLGVGVSAARRHSVER